VYELCCDQRDKLDMLPVTVWLLHEHGQQGTETLRRDEIGYPLTAAEKVLLVVTLKIYEGS